MQFKKIIDLLEKICPKNLADAEDYVGLQTGNPQDKINKILIALDCSNRVIQQAIKNNCNLIISHHPLLWPNLEEASKVESIKNKLAILNKNNISVYSLHTNYDTKFLRFEMLEQTTIQLTKAAKKEMIIFGDVAKKTTFTKILDQIKLWYSIRFCQYWAKNKNQIIKTVALVPGAGGFAIEELAKKKIDLLITGELKWSQWIKCRDLNQSVITIGHQIEQSFILNLKKLLSKQISEKIKILEYWEAPIDTI